MTATAPLPEVRNLRFALDEGLRPRYWHGGRKAVTIFSDNLSLFFPEGEAFFIRSIRDHQHLAVTEDLRAQVKAFCAQEGIHTREHIRYNEMLRAHGYRTDRLERGTKWILAATRRVLPARTRLAVTAALEHFTAAMGHAVLGNPRLFDDADPVMAALWRWHAAEEYEHKALAFDLYRLAGGGYAERAAIMGAATAIFWAKVLEQQVSMMQDAGIATDPREWADLAHALFVDPGVLTSLSRVYGEWYRPDFHPRDLECLAPYAAWQRAYASDPVYEASREAARQRRPRNGGNPVGATDRPPAEPEAPPARVEVAIVGTGFSGLGMAIRLQQEGQRSFAILEKADEVGGTWRENRYPGCACDVPAHLYSFSFEPNAAWSRKFAPQPEILAYLRRTAEKHGLYPKIRFGQELRSAVYDEGASLWRLRTGKGETLAARHLVLGVGALHRPSWPQIPGRERFQGRSFHSAQWDEGYDLGGKRVAVIGTGASAIQFVPRIAPLVARLELFQRTPPWVLPIDDRDFTTLERALFERVPFARRLYRAWIYAKLETYAAGFAYDPRILKAAEWLGRWHLWRRVKDPVLRKKLTPTFSAGCKRLLISNAYYPALCRENVSVVTDGIREITERGVVTADGREHAVDAIIYGTGFRVAEGPPRGQIVGRGGLDLADAWRERISAYLGTTVAGFPDCYQLMGPNTGLGHSSMVFMIESQIEHVLACMRAASRQDASVEVRPEAQRAFVESLGPKLDRSVWGTGCKSWYLDEKGQNSTTWPGFTFEFWWRARGMRSADYAFAPLPKEAPARG